MVFRQALKIKNVYYFVYGQKKRIYFATLNIRIGKSIDF